MADDLDLDRYVGRITGRGTLVVERAPITAFAAAVCDADPVYRNARVARAAGFDDVPAPPTFAFAVQHWATWDELQPEDPTPDGAPMAELFGALMASGGLILHGEQEFHYLRPIVAGQRLTFEGVVRDVYRKQSGERTMTFMVTEDRYYDEGELVLTSTMNLIHRS